MSGTDYSHWLPDTPDDGQDSASEIEDNTETDPNEDDHWLPTIPPQDPNQPGGQIVDIGVVGVTFKNRDGSSRQEAIKGLQEGEAILLRREPDNPHDPNAIAVDTRDGDQIGYLPRHGFADEYAPRLDARSPPTWPGHVKKKMGGYDEKAWGVIISIEIPPESA